MIGNVGVLRKKTTDARTTGAARDGCDAHTVAHNVLQDGEHD
jgi:hypothetical protein